MSDKRITVGVPSGGYPKIEFVNSLVLLAASGLISEVLIIPRLPVQQARTQIANRFGGTHLLMIDDDMIFNTSDIELLINADKPIVSGLFRRRSADPKYVVYELRNDKFFFRDPPTELSQVDGSSLACTLIERSVFEKVGSEFKFRDQYGEDQDFMLRCREAGIEWWIEPNAKIGHQSEVIL